MTNIRETKKLSFTCEPCRKRKVKCDGAEPRCSRCQVRKDVCEYKQSPTLAYTHTLERRVHDLEAEVRTLLEKLDGQKPKEAFLTPVASASHAASPTSDTQATNVTPDFKGLKVDDKGVTTYYGSTSFFHRLDGHDGDAPGPSDSMRPSLNSTVVDHSRQKLVMNAWQQRVHEHMSQAPEPFQYLLNLHWCWVQPLFNFIYRPAFTRDMSVMGPYYTHTLMNALLSHSIRWGRSDDKTRELLKPYDDGAVFARHARTMVLDEINLGVCSIPTVQAVLLLSAQECSVGNSLAAWVYSGIAFRLVDHLGIQFDSQRYAGSVALTDEDMEIRRRLFWSCYFWDKLVSLYLGRRPSLQQSSVSPPQRMLDDSTDDELWVPCGVTYPDGQQYAPTPSHSTATFTQMCRLSVIFNQILIHMYDPTKQNTEAEMQDCLVREEESLNNWWTELSPCLRIDTSQLPDVSPPAHIVTMNCLYRTFRILLYRPMLSRRSPASDVASFEPNPQHLVECVTAASSILSIFDLFCRTFHEKLCTLSLSYSVYIASSIFLLQVQASNRDYQAQRRLEYCLNTLCRAMKTNKVIGKAVALVIDAVNELDVDIVVPSIPQEPGADAPMSEPSSSFHDTSKVLPSPLGVPNDTEYQFPHLDSLDLEALDFSPELFEAVANLEPLSVRMASLDDPAVPNNFFE